jgi:hypothetical protein
VPVFKDKPLIVTDNVTGKTILNRDVAFDLVASLTLTMRDVYRFSSSLDLGHDSDNAGEQLLQMVDCRFSETR